MENSVLFKSKEINFIYIFNKILIVFLLIFLIIFFTFRINDSIVFHNGEIIANNPEIYYNAPYEVELKMILVKEGDIVTKGDTLAILKSTQIKKNVDNTHNEISNLTNQLSSNQNNISILQQKKDLLINKKELFFDEYKLNKLKTKNEIKNKNKKLVLFKHKQKLEKEKITSDSILFKKGIISLYDYRKSKDAYLTIKSRVIEIESNIDNLKARVIELTNNYLQNKSRINTNIIDLKEKIESILQSRNSIKNSINQENINYNYLNSELNKVYIISEIDGVISNVFNEKMKNNFLKKGENIIRVSPLENNYYVKARIDEREIKYIKVNQKVILKLDSYYYYEYGALKGVVKSIPIRKNDKESYIIIIKLNNENKFNLKSGYSLKGEVVTENLLLYQYIIKKILKSNNIL